MTNLRKAAEMALYALLDARQVMDITYKDKHAYADEIEALRQALAQPEQANPIDTYERAYYEGKRAGIAESEAIKTQPEQEYEYAVCECHRCISEKKLMLYGVPRNLAKMIVCIECGNKRCPKASDHRLACTGSNEVGQEESIYTAQPEQSQTSGYAKKIESLIKERDDLRQALAQPDPEHFCDTHCTWRDHHPDCKLAQPEQEPVANEVQLNIIRWWPDGFANRLEHVWKDLIGFIPNYKLLDLQRLLAEFGFTMKIYEGEAPTISEPVNGRISEPVENLEPVACIGMLHPDHFEDVCRKSGGNSSTPLYTAPPKREWVPLTDEQIAEIAAVSALKTPDDIYFARLIEAMLKEKNI